MKRKSIYILSTGGTIAMQKSAEGYLPSSGYLSKCLLTLPELQNEDMPLYTLEEYEQPIDSANMTLSHWAEIGEKIQKVYDHYDGFVILHGTDTMAYTASALSFMLENLAKPVIFTGAQLPLFETRSDARENLINAILLAGHYDIPEVCIYFNNKLFRGNRAKKIDASSFSAFGSPNFSVLAKIGTEIVLHKNLLLDKPRGKLHLQQFRPLGMSVLKIFPGMCLKMLKEYLRPPLQALVLETYGLGTAPDHPELLGILEAAIQAGIVIVNCSQCPTAKVRMGAYVTGSALLKAGVISGGDMTVEACLAKLFYLFSKNIKTDEIKKQITQDCRGELTR